MLLKRLIDHGFVCVYVRGRMAGGGGGGGSAREPTEMFSTAVSAAPLKMRQNMEVE